MKTRPASSMNPCRKTSVPLPRDMEIELGTILNGIRKCKGLSCLQQSKSLDHIAGMQAQFMAAQCKIERAFEVDDQGKTPELQEILNSDFVGEVVHVGSTTLEIHLETLKSDSTIVFSPDFNEFGISVAKGNDGSYYMCLLFRRAA
jgi:uncharacterized protein YkwD